MRASLSMKPYWGENSEARIIHFHGPKPFQQNTLESHFPELKPFSGGAYQAVAKRWSDLLQDARCSSGECRVRWKPHFQFLQWIPRLSLRTTAAQVTSPRRMAAALLSNPLPCGSANGRSGDR